MGMIETTAYRSRNGRIVE